MPLAKNREELTVKQKKVLEFIRKRINTDIPPTIREISRSMGFSSTGTTRDYLNALEKKSYLKRTNNLSRGITLTEGAFKIPIVGTIVAGKPDLAYEDIQGYIHPDDLFLGSLSLSDVFALRVKGDSMAHAGIMDGDIAIIKKQPSADNGDIVAALTEGSETTLKRFRRKGTTILLEPANPAYNPIYKNFSIIGKLITIIRKY